jgi:hypothetical protein
MNVFSASEEVGMIQAFLGGPLLLLIDDNPGRIEYWEYLLFKNEYRVKSVSVNNLEEKGAMDNVKLVLSYIPFEPEKVTKHGIPVLFVIPDGTSVEEYVVPDNLLTAYVSASASSELLLAKISGLVGS